MAFAYVQNPEVQWHCFGTGRLQIQCDMDRLVVFLKQFSFFEWLQKQAKSVTARMQRDNGLYACRRTFPMRGDWQCGLRQD